MTTLMVGMGSVGGAIAQRLDLRGPGLGRIILVDLKPYSERHVGIQCETADVGRWKVEVAAERLRQRGVDVIAMPRDLEEVPHGVVGPGSLVITCVDNRRGDILANRLAVSVGAKLLKVNVEPSIGIVACRAFQFGIAPTRCVECQFTDNHYQRQQHPRSCDGVGIERATASPVWLSRAAGEFGAMIAAELITADLPGAAIAKWYGFEWQLRSGPAGVRRSELSSNPNCRASHQTAWLPQTRLAGAPSQYSLDDLVRRFGGEHEQLRVRFCHDVVLSARCAGGCPPQPVVTWIRDREANVGICKRCGGAQFPVPFFSERELTLEKLSVVRELPFSDWGLEPFSVIQLLRGERFGNEHHTFVLGGAAWRESGN